ncbi:low affinity immunoglobulin gamma Fc region receptor II-b-like [Scomber japonicus]|uniref:low affinity immunoglobulin gamma Fc region receptor II-b-like n=1 Tax=Scomber japonicus TaxID=13676 RepID=UPI002305052B|nr:low affinity immunoglobulin gamma Fc region receptor II-b-like [Scomber japonicus]
MEVTALCSRQFADVRIVPSTLQLFVYESVSFTCEGSAGSVGWKVRNNKGVIKTNPYVTCNNCIDVAIESDSGEYWCEGEEGQRSNAVNITVTAGSVVLESPVLPVMKGEAVTLHCRIKTTSNITADFYKDGVFIKTESTGNTTIQSVSKSNEGLYKCNISGAGESPESWLAVKDQLEIPKDNDSANQSKDPLAQPADKTGKITPIIFPSS